MKDSLSYLDNLLVCNHSREIQMTKTLAAMLDDRNNKTYYNYFVNGHPTWR